MTWDILRNTETNELMLVPTGAPHPDGWVLEAVTANPEYLTTYGPQE